MFIPRIFSPQNIAYANNHSVIAGTTFTETTSSCKDIDSCRTLFQIAWSCISVVIACTWVSVHPNVPGPNEGTWRALRRKIALMFVALIAPEMLILWAARQWSAARKLSKAYGKRHGWTTTHAFFALMGGFALYEGKTCIAVLRFIPPGISDEEKKKITDDLDTPGEKENEPAATEFKFHDHSFAAHVRFVGEMSEQQVKARSHSDDFSKLIAVGQTTWFVIQLIARWAAKLPITELELMTLAFAALNVFIYFFWWHKPQGVGCHIPIQVKKCVKEGDCGGDSTSHMALAAPKKGDSSEDLQNAVTFWRWLREIPESLFTGLGNVAVTSWKWLCGILKSLFTGLGNVAVTSWKWLCGILKSLVPGLYTWSEGWWRTRLGMDIHFEEHHIILKISMVVTCIILAFPLRVFPLRVLAILSDDDGTESEKISSFEQCPDLESFYRDRIITCTAAVLFGALHCIAWQFIFPSTREQLLWRISSIIVTCSPLFLVLLAALNSLIALDVVSVPPWILACLGLILIVMVPLYAVARLDLIVQAFLALRDLPVGAFETVQWSTFIPHIW